MLFVYGTLKRGGRNHHHLAGQVFVGEARTAPGYTLFDLGGYPGIAACATDREGVRGEVWKIEPAALARLDAFEGVHEGLYRREPLPLQAPFVDRRVEAYVSARPMAGRQAVGSEWTE